MDSSGHKQRIGILGGTFDPVHFGHLSLAETMRDRLPLDEVRFIPVRVPPHKERPDISPAEVRCRMVELAIAGRTGLVLSRLEINRQGISYSVETIRELRRREPHNEFVFLVGADALPELAEWKDVRELMRLCRFAVAQRPGFPASALPENAVAVDGPEIAISSSMVRDYVREGRSIESLVPEPVRRYIEEKGLYTE